MEASPWQAVASFAVAALVAIAVVFLRRSPLKPLQPPAPQILRASQPATGPRLAVIGGRGFVGRVIVRQAKGRYAVTVIDTSVPSQAEADPTVTYVAADVRSPAALENALRGMQSVIHTASILPGVGISREFMHGINVGGTSNVVAACVAAGVERLVYTSSATVVLPRGLSPMLDVNESAPYPAQHIDDYTESKHLAEGVVLGAPPSLRVCVVRPGGIFGPGDKQVADPFLRGQDLVVIGAGTAVIDMADVDSIAFGHLCALSHLGTGTDNVADRQIYHLSSAQPMQYRAFNGIGSSFGGDRSRSHWGQPMPRVLPTALVNTLATINEICASTIGVTPLSRTLSVMAITYTQRSWTFDCSKAKREIGYRHVLGSTEDAIAHYVDEFRAAAGLDRRQPAVPSRPKLPAF